MIAVTSLNIKPDLLLILMVFLAINTGGSEAIILSFAIGFAADLIDLPMGHCIISFGLAGSVLSYIRNYIMIKRMLRQSVAIFAAGILVGLLSLLLVFLKGHSVAAGASLVLFAEALYSAVLGPYICSMFTAVARWTGIIKTYRFGRLRTR